MSGEDLAGGVVLKTDEGEFGPTALKPIMAAGVGQRHHAETRAGRASGAIFARPPLLRRGHFGGPQNTAHGFATEGEMVLGAQFLGQMGIVEAPILALRQAYDQLFLGSGDGPRHGASAIAMMNPADGIRPVAALKPLYLALAQMQQAGGFAYAQPPACCIFNHLHSLQFFLTHRHHPGRVTESRCSYGVTLSWSIYTRTETVSSNLSSKSYTSSDCRKPSLPKSQNSPQGAVMVTVVPTTLQAAAIRRSSTALWRYSRAFYSWTYKKIKNRFRMNHNLQPSCSYCLPLLWKPAAAPAARSSCSPIHQSCIPMSPSPTFSS